MRRSLQRFIEAIVFTPAEELAIDAPLYYIYYLGSEHRQGWYVASYGGNDTGYLLVESQTGELDSDPDINEAYQLSSEEALLLLKLLTVKKATTHFLLHLMHLDSNPYATENELATLVENINNAFGLRVVVTMTMPNGEPGYMFTPQVSPVDQRANRGIR